MSVRSKVEVFALAACILALGAGRFQAHRLRAELASAQHARDSLLVEVAADSAALQGWAVRFADTTQAIGELLARQDTQAASLSRSLERAHVREVALTELVAGLQDSLTSVANRTDTTESGEVRYSGALDDGLLTGSWRFTAPALSLSYQARVPIQIVTSQAGDGRWLVTARATDPRASVEVNRVMINPPPPIVERHGPSWWWIPAAGGAGWLAHDIISALWGH